ncbi:MAG: hypothetical protein EA401_05770 [Planctomycetota bacterium]|nr:MAG: hypothetical protein EA401_05770 [Planctomycetota bacterium]
MLFTLAYPTNTAWAQESPGAQTVALSAPLTTVVAAPDWPDGTPTALRVSVSVGEDAPADLGVGAWVSDFDGTWYQHLRREPLSPGTHTLSFSLIHHGWQAVGHYAQWDDTILPELRRGGLLFWTQDNSSAKVTVTDWHFSTHTPERSIDRRQIEDLHLSHMDSDSNAWQISSGERLNISFRATPLPADPYNPGHFSAHVVFTCMEDGSTEHIPAFWKVPMRRLDRGDQERTIAQSSGHFAVRWRPRQPGRYDVRLQASWNDSQLGSAQESPPTSSSPCIDVPLPPLTVTGAAWDDYVRVDPDDPRFFHINGDFYWPIGINLRSVNDGRGARRTGSLITPDRGIYTYHDYLQRFAAAGGNAIEIWMSSWNLALEWRDDWPEFRGLGRYSQAKAQRLDDLLDLAYELGIRVNLVIRNHGQGSERTDREWHNSPFNNELGGPVGRAADFFRDQAALDYQYRYHRYLIARYADHPAILAWKLWSEVDLTAGRRNDVRRWHEITSAQFHAMDVYGHPVTTHWSGDFRRPDRAIVAQDGICFVCIDAYHARRDGEGELIHQLLWRSTQSPAPGQGLHQFSKPVLVTEYGGNWNAAPIPQLIVEHHSGPWAALMAGHAGSPMLWWFEWVDQNNLWAPYHALRAFLHGEDLRSPQARAQRLETGDNELWAAMWKHPERILGYIIDRPWGFDGSQRDSDRSITLRMSLPNDTHTWRWQWWDADRGIILDEHVIQAHNGELKATTPDFRRHLAFKLFPEKKAPDKPLRDKANGD